MTKRALVTGVTGQDGSLMAEWLLSQGYEVYGMMRRSSSLNLWRLGNVLDRITLIEGDLTDGAALRRVLQAAHPEEIYNFAAQTQVGVSFLEPLHTTHVTGFGVLNLLEAIRATLPLTTKLYQASSSEMFGEPVTAPQTEDTPFHPVSPYGCAKLFAHTLCQTYRKAYGMFISCGIAYNHESPRRSEEFVTRKITRTIALIKTGQMSELRLGNLYAKRDWTHAVDVVQGAWKILQQPRPDDFILASGEQHSVQEFVELAFNSVSLDWQQYTKTDPSLYRPTDIQSLVGSYFKAFQLLNWKPTIPFSQLVKEMLDADLALAGYRDSVSPEGSAPFDSVAPVHIEADISPGAD